MILRIFRSSVLLSESIIHCIESMKGQAKVYYTIVVSSPVRLVPALSSLALVFALRALHIPSASGAFCVYLKPRL